MSGVLGGGDAGGGNPDNGSGGDPGANAGAAAAGAGGAGANQISIPENWKDALPEEFRREASLESIKTVQDLTKSYLHAQKMIGRDKVVIPDPKLATDDDWKAFYGKLGHPQDVKDYKFEVPKGWEADQKFIEGFKEFAHKANILPGQAQKLLSWYAEQDKALGVQAQADYKKAIEDGLSAYKTKVGAAFERKVTYANKTLEKFGGDEDVKKFLSNPAVSNSPAMIEMLSKIGEQLFGEDNFEGKDKIKGQFTPQEARQRRNEIMSNQSHPYWNGAHPNHQSAVDEVLKLIEMENPS